MGGLFRNLRACLVCVSFLFSFSIKTKKMGFKLFRLVSNQNIVVKTFLKMGSNLKTTHNHFLPFQKQEVEYAVTYFLKFENLKNENRKKK